MKKTLTCLVSIALALSSCEDKNYDIKVIENQSSSNAIIETSGVSVKDVSQVAVNFFKKNGMPETRCSDFEISQIYDKSGNVAMYVVNFANNGGFVVVSATKNFNPILAYSETGNYDVDGFMPLGLYQWQSSIAETIKYVDELPSDSTFIYRMMWSEYLPQKNIQINEITTTRAIEGDMVQAQLILQDSVMSWQTKGYAVLQVTGSITGDKDIDEEMRNIVPGAIYPLYQEEWERLSVVVRRPGTPIIIENFVQSTWSQRDGYNDAYDRINGSLPPAGCGPVALGQIMRYYEYPKTYNWSAMPYNEASYTTSELLYDIAIAANADIQESSTGTQVGDMLDALQGYNYKYNEVSDHDASKTWNEITQKHPVCMIGTFENTNEGHAWVASGAKYQGIAYVYDLYTFRERFNFVSVYRYTVDCLPIYYFYMNWGWADGYRNGYYHDINIAPTSSGKIIDRIDIYGIVPNN